MWFKRKTKEEKEQELKQKLDRLNIKYANEIKSYCKIGELIFIFIGFTIIDDKINIVYIRKNALTGYYQHMEYDWWKMAYNCGIKEARINFKLFKQDLEKLGLKLEKNTTIKIMKNWEQNEDFLKAVSKPVYKGKYCPILHEVFIDEIQKGLDERKMLVKSKKYLTAQEGKIMIGEYMIDNADTEMNIGITFQNSYNKMLCASIKSGAIVLVCSNGMYGTKGRALKRKHLGVGALEDVKQNIVLCLDNAEAEFKKLIQDREEMKNVKLSKSTISQLVGDMYLNHSLLKETQLSALKKELLSSLHFRTDSAWDFYNNVTEVLKDTHPMDYVTQHLKIYSYLGDKFNLTNKSGLFEKESTLDLGHIVGEAIEFEMIK